jgi:hypothetical protein
VFFRDDFQDPAWGISAQTTHGSGEMISRFLGGRVYRSQVQAVNPREAQRSDHSVRDEVAPH